MIARTRSKKYYYALKPFWHFHNPECDATSLYQTHNIPGHNEYACAYIATSKEYCAAVICGQLRSLVRVTVSTSGFDGLHR